LKRLPVNLKKPQRVLCERLWNDALSEAESALRDIEDALSDAENAHRLEQIERALEETNHLIGVQRIARLARRLHEQAGHLHMAAKHPVLALRELYLAGVTPPEEVLEASGLSGARVIKNRAVPTYFCCDGAEPCNFGLVEIVGDQLERGPISTLPRQVYDLADQAVAYFIPRETSKALTQAAFHAHQAGYSSHATYLARKASEFDPENSVAQRSLEALKAKGIQENGDERSCLDSLWAKHGSPLAILANRGFSLD
jgi:hypothetical protein